MYREILVATNGSSESQRAADHALGLGRALDADVHALSVLTRGVTKRDQLRAEPERETNERLEEIKTTGDEKGVAVSTEIRTGDPCEMIVEVADERDVDLVVMGATVGNRVDRLIHGSTTQCVSNKSPVPVLSVGSETKPIFEQPEDAQYRFYCTSCDSTLTISEETKVALEQRGCILCGEPVADDAFTAMEGESA